MQTFVVNGPSCKCQQEPEFEDVVSLHGDKVLVDKDMFVDSLALFDAVTRSFPMEQYPEVYADEALKPIKRQLESALVRNQDQSPLDPPMLFEEENNYDFVTNDSPLEPPTLNFGTANKQKTTSKRGSCDMSPLEAPTLNFERGT